MPALGSMEAEYRAAARLRIEAVRESRFDVPCSDREMAMAVYMAGRSWRRPLLYFSAWISTPVRVTPSFLASMTPAALPST